MKSSFMIEGWVTVGEHGEGSGILLVNGEPFAEMMEPADGEKVFLHYHVSERQMTLEECQAELLNRVLGLAESEFFHRYSDPTGYLWTVENCCVGGHNMIAELSSHAGRWLCMQIIVGMD